MPMTIDEKRKAMDNMLKLAQAMRRGHGDGLNHPDANALALAGPAMTLVQRCVECDERKTAAMLAGYHDQDFADVVVTHGLMGVCELAAELFRREIEAELNQPKEKR